MYVWTIEILDRKRHVIPDRITRIVFRLRIILLYSGIVTPNQWSLRMVNDTTIGLWSNGCISDEDGLSEMGHHLFLDLGTVPL